MQPVEKEAMCQSCGMPLSKDPQGGGTEADGAHSGEYCSHCYRAGAFTVPDMTLESMQANVKKRLEDMGLPAAQVQALTAAVARLKRWSVS
jgi:hypothetical protein